jgi:hypothetical protein
MRPLVIAALALGLVGLTGCAKSDPAAARRDDCTCAGSPVVDAALLAFLSKARSAHHEADLAEGQGDRARAVAALDKLALGPRPAAAGGLPPEAAEVLADTFARLADLRSQSGDHAGGLRNLETGLSLAERPTHFRGHLFEMKGVILERLAKEQDAAHEATPAKLTKARAMDAFETAIKIQDQVIDEALSGHPAHDGGAARP